MDGDEFYQTFKDALNYIGLGWVNRKLASVTIENGGLKISYGSRHASIDLADHEEEDTREK